LEVTEIALESDIGLEISLAGSRGTVAEKEACQGEKIKFVINSTGSTESEDTIRRRESQEITNPGANQLPHKTTNTWETLGRSSMANFNGIEVPNSINAGHSTGGKINVSQEISNQRNEIQGMEVDGSEDEDEKEFKAWLQSERTKAHFIRDTTDSDNEELDIFNFGTIMAALTQIHGDGERRHGTDADKSTIPNGAAQRNELETNNSSAGKGYNQQSNSTPAAGGAAQFLVLPVNQTETELRQQIASHKQRVESLNVRG
jgi:hypothetical protein